jgi:hypothetical protein
MDSVEFRSPLITSVVVVLTFLFAFLLGVSGMLATDADTERVGMCLPSQVPCAGRRLPAKSLTPSGGFPAPRDPARR